MKENSSAGADRPVPVPAPAALRARVRSLGPSMTRSVQAVAEAVAEDPAACAALTVSDLAARTGTSEATVVRTARLLGYPGYRDLRLALAALAAQQESGAAPAVTVDIAVDDSLADVVAKLAQEEAQTLADTAAGLDVAALGSAVAALAGARRIEIYGVGASGLVAQDLAQKLQRIGLIAHAHSDPHLAVTTAVLLRPGDVAVAITHSGGTGDVIEPLRTAFERGATTLALTARAGSPSSTTPTSCWPPPPPARPSCARRPCRAGPASSSSWTACSWASPSRPTRPRRPRSQPRTRRSRPATTPPYPPPSGAAPPASSSGAPHS